MREVGEGAPWGAPCEGGVRGASGLRGGEARWGWAAWVRGLQCGVSLPIRKVIVEEVPGRCLWEMGSGV